MGRGYEVVHQDSPNDRGIDCAILYDATVVGLFLLVRVEPAGAKRAAWGLVPDQTPGSGRESGRSMGSEPGDRTGG